MPVEWRLLHPAHEGADTARRCSIRGSHASHVTRHTSHVTLLQYLGQVQAALRDDRNWRWMQQDRNMKETGTVLRDEAQKRCGTCFMSV